MPEPKQTGGQAGPGEALEQRPESAALSRHATDGTRTTRAISWAGWHLGELAGVSVALGLGLSVWEGFYGVAGVVALVWVANEIRLYSKQKAIRAGRMAGTSADRMSIKDEEERA